MKPLKKKMKIVCFSTYLLKTLMLKYSSGKQASASKLAYCCAPNPYCTSLTSPLSKLLQASGPASQQSPCLALATVDVALSLGASVGTLEESVSALGPDHRSFSQLLSTSKIYQIHRIKSFKQLL